MDALATQLTWRVMSAQALVHCPICRFPTRRVHRRYVRTVAALPWASWRVVLHLQVRKFCCANGRCPRRIFTERLWPLVAPWARRTPRLMQWLTRIALALGGRAGVRLSRTLGLAISRHTLLRLVRRLPMPEMAPPQVLGVDDWADRKRQTYGTVLIDLARRRPLALLPDREAKTFALWWQAHPGVAVITRDRSRAYTDGARQGAPEAIQVADRFPLLQNLAEALDQVLNAHGHILAAVNAALHQAPVPQPDGTVAVPVPPPLLRTRPGSWPTTARHSGWHSTNRSGACPSRGGPGGPSPSSWESASIPSIATSVRRRCRSASAALTAVAVFSPPITRISSNAGTRGTGTPCACSERANGVGIRGATRPWRAMPSACARRQVRRLGSGSCGRPDQW
jgi:Transposase